MSAISYFLNGPSLKGESLPNGIPAPRRDSVRSRQSRSQRVSGQTGALSLGVYRFKVRPEVTQHSMKIPSFQLGKWNIFS
jgi:hypothetical protein